MKTYKIFLNILLSLGIILALFACKGSTSPEKSLAGNWKVNEEEKQNGPKYPLRNIHGIYQRVIKSEHGVLQYQDWKFSCEFGSERDYTCLYTMIGTERVTIHLSMMSDDKFFGYIKFFNYDVNDSCTIELYGVREQ